MHDRRKALGLIALAPFTPHLAQAMCVPTGADVEGPFFRARAPRRTRLAKGEKGSPLHISGAVQDLSCQGLPGAEIEVWQANAEGDYPSDDRLRARLRAGPSGRYAFDTIMPGRYALGGSYRPAHIHFKISAPGMQPLTTQLCFAGDPYLPPKDPCGTCNAGDPTKIITLSKGRGVFVINLSPLRTP